MQCLAAQFLLVTEGRRSKTSFRPQWFTSTFAGHRWAVWLWGWTGDRNCSNTRARARVWEALAQLLALPETCHVTMPRPRSVCLAPHTGVRAVSAGCWGLYEIWPLQLTGAPEGSTRNRWLSLTPAPFLKDLTCTLMGIRSHSTQNKMQDRDISSSSACFLYPVGKKKSQAPGLWISYSHRC